jgi:thiamine pyrophosphate-dependent acetolactate synthase large subunit-like protein
MLQRREAVAVLLAHRPRDLLVVSGLGSATYDLAAAGDDARNFYLWGAMGGALSMGLGLALAQPSKRILVLTGDGELLMGLGSLATVGVQAVRNIAVADLAAVARACRFRDAMTVRKPEELGGLRELLLRAPGPVLGVIKTAAADVPRVLPERDGHAIRTRFRGAVVG